jgi:hypothetical protein
MFGKNIRELARLSRDEKCSRCCFYHAPDVRTGPNFLHFGPFLEKNHV